MTDPNDNGVTRRQALGAGVVGAATLGVATIAAASGTSSSGSVSASTSRMPVAFVPHGGGPWPFVDLGLQPSEVSDLTTYLQELRSLPKTPPKALLVISAHWEERVPTVLTGTSPPILYDYYGFPQSAYSIPWPAPGSPALAARVRELLEANSIASAEDPKRGFDHGTFIPFKLTYPNAEIPTIQLSLKAGLDPAEHLSIGRALAPLRDEGIFILGSGMSYHNMRGFGDARARGDSEIFDTWLREAAVADPAERDRKLAAWTQAPAARQVHPREEHLIPLMVVAGAAGRDKGTAAFGGSMMGKRISAFHFG